MLSVSQVLIMRLGMIKVAKRKYPNESVSYEIADLSKTLKYDSGHFDHAISISSLQAVPDPVFSLKELSRVVKIGGSIVLVHFRKPDLHQQSLHHQVQTQMNHTRTSTVIEKLFLYIKSISERNGFSKYWSIDELKDILNQAALTIYRVEKAGTILIIEAKNS